MKRVVPTDAPPVQPAPLVDDFTPSLIDAGAHQLWPGCGEPIAMRAVVETIDELGLYPRAVGCFRHRLLHRVLQQPRRRGAAGAARPGAVAGDRASSGPGPTPSSSPSKATATWSTRVFRRSSTPRPGART